MRARHSQNPQMSLLFLLLIQPVFFWRDVSEIWTSFQHINQRLNSPSITLTLQPKPLIHTQTRTQKSFPLCLLGCEINPNQVWHQAPRGDFRAGESQQQQLLCTSTCWLWMSPRMWTCVYELLGGTLGYNTVQSWKLFSGILLVLMHLDEVRHQHLTYCLVYNCILTLSFQHQTLQLNIVILCFR